MATYLIFFVGGLGWPLKAICDFPGLGTLPRGAKEILVWCKFFITLSVGILVGKWFIQLSGINALLYIPLVYFLPALLQVGFYAFQEVVFANTRQPGVFVDIDDFMEDFLPLLALGGEVSGVAFGVSQLIRLLAA